MTHKPPASLVSPAGEEPTPPTAPTPSLGSPRSSVGDGEDPTPTVRCSFCGRAKDQVVCLVQAPSPTILICDQCTDAAAFIVAEKRIALNPPGVPAGSPEGEPRQSIRIVQAMRRGEQIDATKIAPAVLEEVDAILDLLHAAENSARHMIEVRSTPVRDEEPQAREAFAILREIRDDGWIVRHTSGRIDALLAAIDRARSPHPGSPETPNG